MPKPKKDSQPKQKKTSARKPVKKELGQKSRPLVIGGISMNTLGSCSSSRAFGSHMGMNV